MFVDLSSNATCANLSQGNEVLLKIITYEAQDHLLCTFRFKTATNWFKWSRNKICHGIMYFHCYCFDVTTFVYFILRFKKGWNEIKIT